MGADRVAVIGAGIGGLAAAIDLASRGFEVVVLERAAKAGGKMRETFSHGLGIDSGPTVLTMRDVFEDLFAAAGASLDEAVTLRPLKILARHAWGAGAHFDLHADPAAAEDAVGAFFGRREAVAYRRFSRRAREIFETLETTFIRAQVPNMPELVRRVGVSGLPALGRIGAFTTMWSELGTYFADRRLRQLFARYATYSGSSPWLAPATLMLIAHVEQAGVWTVAGGMQRLAEALEALAARLGVRFRFGAEVREIAVVHGAVSGIALSGGEEVAVDAVVCNADAAALANGAFGAAPRRALARTPGERSLSACVWTLVGRTRGLPLARHNVFFCEDYAREFADVFVRRRLPRTPTVYVCAQDRLDGQEAPDEAQRLMCLVNAPAVGDCAGPSPEEIDECRSTAFATIQRMGLEIAPEADIATTDPKAFEALFPATGGALYGAASHGWRASFDRPGARTRLPGLYLAGGSAHPGAGVPMAALSGRLAAQAITQDRDLRARSRRTATSGGTSTR